MTLDGEVVVYGSGTSGFVRKLRVLLLEYEVTHRFIVAPPWSDSGGVDKLNPLHKVPVLELADGERLFDSRVAVQYLDLRLDGALLPRDPLERIEALRIEALADGVGDAVGLLTQEGWRRPEARSAFWCERQRAKIVAGIALLDELLLEAPASPLPAPWVAAGAAIGFADFWQPGIDWRAGAPRLAAKVATLDAFASWQQTRPVLSPGFGFPAL